MFARLSEDSAGTLLAEKGVTALRCEGDGGTNGVPTNRNPADASGNSDSVRGTTMSALRSNPPDCLPVDEIASDLQWRSVLAFGNFEEITNSTERAEVLNKLLQRHPMLTPVESTIVQDGAPPPVIVFRIRIDRITGIAEK